jgi:anti-anti-sigma regulatory factor
MALDWIECPIELLLVHHVGAPHGNDVQARVLGELTHATQDDVVALLSVYCDAGLQVDLSSVQYFDAGGVTALLRLRAGCERSGRPLRVRRPTRHVRWVLGLVDLDGLLLDGAEIDGSPPVGSNHA